MSRLVIKGRKRLRGVFTPSGNKNAALPMLACCLLTDETVTLRHVPRILDVEVMLALLDDLGVSIEREGHTVRLRAHRLRARDPDRNLYRKARGSVLLAGPLLARTGRAGLPAPGGDVIGRRRLHVHRQVFEALGARAAPGRTPVYRARVLRGAFVALEEASVTGTENALMAAVLASGTTTLFHAACEPGVQDLCALLRAMGARIRGDGCNRIEIDGVERLHGAEHAIRPDYIEMGSYLAAAAVTGGSLTVPRIPDPLCLTILGRVFSRLGLDWTVTGDVLSFEAPDRLRIRSDVDRSVPSVEDGIWPAFPSDLMSVAVVLATQAKGRVLFFEKMFESRMYFVDRLIEMGAEIVPCDPHRIVTAGPSRLHGIHMSSPDIRAGMAMLIAALGARGESTIENVRMIDRGYEDVDGRLRALGADVVREA